MKAQAPMEQEEEGEDKKSEEESTEKKPLDTLGARPHHRGAAPAHPGCPAPWPLGVRPLCSQPLAAPPGARAWDPRVPGPSQPPAWHHPECLC